MVKTVAGIKLQPEPRGLAAYVEIYVDIFQSTIE